MLWYWYEKGQQRLPNRNKTRNRTRAWSKTQINKTRKKLGTVNECRRKSNTKNGKIKHLLNINTIPTAIYLQRMKLEVLCKSWDQKSENKQFKNNKLYWKNQKNFYNTLRFGKLRRTIAPLVGIRSKSFEVVSLVLMLNIIKIQHGCTMKKVKCKRKKKQFGMIFQLKIYYHQQNNLPNGKHLV